MPTGLELIRVRRRADRRALKRKILIVILVLIGILAVSVCLRSTTIGFISPLQAAKNLWAGARIYVSGLFHWDFYNLRGQVIASHPYYYETIGHFRATLVAMGMGAVLGMSGGIYQNVFRNPIATPAMLGVSSGVNISNLILVAVYGTTAVTLISWRFVLGFAVAVVSLMVIFLLSKLMGGKKSSVTDMLLVGTVFMRVVQNFITVYQSYLMTDDDYLTLEQLNTYGSNLYEGKTILIVFGILLAAFITVFLMRFSLNAVSYTDEEAKTMGVNAGRMRIIVLVAGTIMVTAAQVNYGDVGMMALLIPHFCRNWFGCDFRYVLLGSAGCGAIMLVICRLIRYMLGFNRYLSFISFGVIINIIIIPLILVILVRQRKTWNQA